MEVQRLCDCCVPIGIIDIVGSGPDGDGSGCGCDTAAGTGTGEGSMRTGRDVQQSDSQGVGSTESRGQRWTPQTKRGVFWVDYDVRS
jgi:hypothetical protein